MTNSGNLLVTININRLPCLLEGVGVQSITSALAYLVLLNADILLPPPTAYKKFNLNLYQTIHHKASIVRPYI
jgi:hypothetical protein